MFPGTNFQPPHYFYQVGATTIPESSGGDVNYNAMPPAPDNITKFHWRRDYVDGSSWTETSFPGFESPDGYSADGYDAWATNSLSAKLAKDLQLHNGVNLTGSVQSTYVIEVPEDVAMGSKEVIHSPYTNLWYTQAAVITGAFPAGSTVIIHNSGVIAGGGGMGGSGGAIYHSGTPNNDACGGGGGGGSGLHDRDLPFTKHEQGDNYGAYPLDAQKDGTGPYPDQCFAGHAGSSSLYISVFNGDEAANGAFGKGNLVSTGFASYANGGAGSALNGITHPGVPVDADGIVSHMPGTWGGEAIMSGGQNVSIWIYNYSTGKMYGGGGGGGGGVGIGNTEGDGGDGGPPGEAGEAGESGGAGGASGEVFSHHALWDPAGATQSKFIIKQNDGIIKGREGDNSAFGVGTEH